MAAGRKKVAPGASPPPALARVISVKGLEMEGGKLRGGYVGQTDVDWSGYGGIGPWEGLGDGWEEAIGAPEWATARWLGFYARPSETRRLLLHPVMAGLEVVRNIGVDLLGEMARSDFDWAVTRAEFYRYEHSDIDIDALAAARSLPRLRHLAVSPFDDIDAPEDFGFLRAGALGERLESLELSMYLFRLAETLGGWIALAGATAVEQLTIRSTEWHLQLARGSGGRLSELTLLWPRGPSPTLKRVLAALGSVEPGQLRRVTVTGTKTSVKMLAKVKAAEWEALRAACARLRAKLELPDEAAR